MASPASAAARAEGRVDLWYVRPEEAADAGLLEAYRGLLSADETEQLHRYRVAPKRHEHLVARALLRTALSRYAPVDPREWAFARNLHGKPSIVRPAGTGLEFNLSHTDGLIVCLVAAGCDVGVDVEDRTRGADCAGLAGRFFAATEAALVQGLPAADQADAFYRLWTLKEAYVKARGVGLSIPLGGFAFDLRKDGPTTIELYEGLHDTPDAWQFGELRLGGRHQVALAVRRRADRPLAVRLCPTLPLRRSGDPRDLEGSATRRWDLP